MIWRTCVNRVIGRRWEWRELFMYRAWWFGAWKPVRLVKRLMDFEMTDEVMARYQEDMDD